MILDFSADLSEQHVIAHGDELASVMARDRGPAGERIRSWPLTTQQHVATLRNPVLVTDHHKIAQLPAVQRDTVFKLFESALRVTRYNGTELAFEQRRWPGVWGPNIDTLVLCQALTGAVLGPARRALEIGCGSGFIGKYVLEHAPQLERMSFVDIDQLAVDCAREAVKDTRAEFVKEDGLRFMTGRAFDLVVCNPPYIPRPGASADNPYEGISLLASFIREGVSHLAPGGRFVVIASSVSRSVLDPLLKASSARVERLASHVVPLKVLNVLNNRDWMSFLLEKKGLHAEPRDGYDYWHTIDVLSIRA